MHRFVLTPEEKRVIIFVVVAFLLGFGAKHYRDAHPAHPPIPKQKAALRYHRN